MANTYTVKLIDRKEIAEGTMEFHFEKPLSFEFKAGQNADWYLINPPETDDEGNKRTFSLVSTPNENILRIATRMRDTAFKRVLKTIPLGSEIKMEGPYGSFMLHNDTTRPAVFLIGGIGITPVHSILVDASEKKLPHRIYLFYSNRRPEDTAYLTELSNLQNDNYTFIGTMTDMDKSNQQWPGETSYINAEMIQKYVKEEKPVYYISGPEAMVTAIRTTLHSININDDDIRTEEFSGY